LVERARHRSLRGRRRGWRTPADGPRWYGDDEPLVHAKLNPEIIVITDPDRVRGVEKARALGADCAILDDAFQHRRVRRTADWVLVAAEQWRTGLRSLPAGPLRESAASLRRADVLIVTRKSAARERAEEVAGALASRLRPGSEVAICHLAPYAAHGADVEPLAFADHHAFDARDVARIVRTVARRAGVVCTLKDAVKLAPLWPSSAPPLWYVSQRVVVERGGAALDASLEGILAARVAAPPTAGAAGPSSPPHGHRSSTADR
jgi:tetraacyldisaccharide 4'-kinase